MLNIVELEVAAPGVRAFRTTTDALRTGIKDYYAVGRVVTGRSQWWSRGKVWQSEPGSIQVKEAGDIHRDIAIDGVLTYTAIALPTKEIALVREAGTVLSLPHIDAGDRRADAFHRLLDAVEARADRLTLEVTLAEAVATFARLSDLRSEHTRPVRRAREYLRERLADAVTLDELAAYVGLDKFHLCRAFRAQVGIAPHAYLTHLRVQRARQLLSEGVRASEIAPRVGLYDQSQLTRHFARIVGTTPARYGSERTERKMVRDAAGEGKGPLSCTCFSSL